MIMCGRYGVRATTKELAAKSSNRQQEAEIGSKRPKLAAKGSNRRQKAEVGSKRQMYAAKGSNMQ